MYCIITRIIIYIGSSYYKEHFKQKCIKNVTTYVKIYLNLILNNSIYSCT